MVVRLSIRELAEKKEFSNPRQLSLATGIPYAACHALWNGEQKQISVETINKLCEALKVKPGQLFDYTPD
jgi:DNA-binding Xre family transcriptional regulator